MDPVDLLESWVKHTLVGINRWADDGVAPLHREWRGLAHGMGKDISVGDVGVITVHGYIDRLSG